MPQPFVWNVDPVLARVGPLTLRYYGICFGLALLTALTVWRRRALRYGETTQVAEGWVWYGLLGAIGGGRLGECLFYRPRYFLAHPLEIPMVWRGGIASHGAAIGIALALWWFAHRMRRPVRAFGDYLVPAAALGATWIRVGNFFNSEIVGRPAPGVPWAVVFARHDAIPRHPVQLYEVLTALATWLVLHVVERRRVRPIGSGLLAGTFFVVYFGLRLWVERYKEFMDEQLRTLPPFSTVEHLLGAPIHTGQWLSVVGIAGGVLLIALALRRPRVSVPNDGAPTFATPALRPTDPAAR